jgi:hypothetical protein
MSKFKVNEMALVAHSYTYPERVGEEVQIVEGIQPRMKKGGEVVMGYRISWSDGRTYISEEWQLRKKPDPTIDRFLAQCHEKAKPVSFDSLMSDLKGPLTEETVERTFVKGMWSTK